MYFFLKKTVKYHKCIFPYDFKNVYFALVFFKNIMHNTCYVKKYVLILFMSSARLPVSSRLLVVEFWGESKVHTEF